MARDPLRILLGIRQRTVDEARRALAACIQAESDIADRIRSHDESIQRDSEVSAAWAESHRFHEMSALRLAALRTARRRMEADLAAAEARSATAREAVVAARSAAEAVEQLINERAAAATEEANKQEQHASDDIARTRHGEGPRTGV